MDANKKNIAVIGAGITGLTTAYYLLKNGMNVTVFEKNNRTGGVMYSFSENNFVYEYGPNTGTLSNIETVKLLIDELGDEVEIQIPDKRSKKRLVWKNGKWHSLPADPVNGLLTPLFTMKDKFRILGEPFRKPGTDPMESVADLVIRRMGKSYLDYAIDPFISGIYAGDPHYLVTKYALPKLYDLEQDYGSFIGGAIKKGKEPKSEDDKRVTKEIFSAKGGLVAIIKALENKIGSENIRLNASVKVEKNEQGYKIGDETFDYVVSTVNATQLQQVFDFFDSEELKNIVNLKYAKVVEIALGFNRWSGINLNAFGGLIPTVENKNILGILFMSTLFEGRAPEGGALLTAFVGGIKKPNLVEMPEKDLLELLEPEFKELLGLKEFNPDLLKVFYHDKAIAQYGADSKERLEAIENIEKKYGNLYLAGSIRDGIGMADRIKQATEIANDIIAREAK